MRARSTTRTTEPVVFDRWLASLSPVTSPLVGSIPCFLGLAVVIPLLGHATWHLYRKAIEADPNARPLPPPVRQRKPAADFPANLFPWKRRDKL